jgi:hypothetical protein
VDYKALIGLSLLWVPHFYVRHEASLKDLNLDTTCTVKPMIPRQPMKYKETHQCR